MATTRNKKVLVFVGSGGGGHMATARALMAGCELARKPFEFKVVEVSEVVGFGASVGDSVYNWLMNSGRADWVPAWHMVGMVMRNFKFNGVTDHFAKFLANYEFDVIVCCLPFVSGFLLDAVAGYDWPPPVVTLMSDFENSQDHPWMQDHRQHLICGTEVSLKQAEALGHPADRVYGISGMVVHPSFYETPEGWDRQEELAKAHLDPTLRTCMVMFGAFGPSFLPAVVHILLTLDERLNLIVMCGKMKDEIIQALEPLVPEDRPWLPVGFTLEVAYYMRLSDFLVGKPGPGVVSECLIIGVPPIVILGAQYTPPQEKSVAEWLRSEGLGIVISNFSELPEATSKSRVDECKAAISAAQKNNAVFEVPHVLEGILKVTERKHRRIASATSVKDIVQQQRTSETGSAEVKENGHAEESSPAPSVDAMALVPDSDAKVDSISVESPSYLDYAYTFREPLRLDEEHLAREKRILINASGRWGHDVIRFSVSEGEPGKISISFTAGYLVTWMKQLVIFNGSSSAEVGRLQTKNENHGPMQGEYDPAVFSSGSVRIDFFKAGFLGIRTHGYTRYLDAAWCVGRRVDILWERERYSHYQPQ